MTRAGLCTLTPSARQQEADWLAQVVADSKVKPTAVPGFTGIKPLPARTTWRDPAVKLKRQARSMNRLAMQDFAAHRKEIEDREKLRAMVESLT